MNTKIIFLDLDGTVLRDDKQISEYTLQTLKKCQDNGIIIVVATARSEIAASKYTKLINPDYIISNGGALVKNSDRVIFKCTIDATTSNQIVKEIMTSEDYISVSVETDTGYYATWEIPDSDDYSHAINYTFEIPLNKETYKITPELKSDDTANLIAKKFSSCSMVKFSYGPFYSLYNKKVSKLNAIKELLSYLKIDVCQSISFGDDFNDIPMINGCGIGVAMGNAIDEVKNIADYICDTNENDGVARWIINNVRL